MLYRLHHKAIALLLAALLVALLPGAPESAFATTQLASDGAASFASDGMAASEAATPQDSDGYSEAVAANDSTASDGAAIQDEVINSDGNAAPDGIVASDGNTGVSESANSDGSAAANGSLGSDGSTAVEENMSSDGNIGLGLPADPDGHRLGILPTLSGHKASSVDTGWRARVLLGLPSKFDLRSSFGSSRVSPVKDQGIYGTCWSFSSLASLESNLLMQGASTRDLSELQLSYFTYMRDADTAARGGGTVGDTVLFTPGNIAPSDSSPYYVNHVLDRGGNAEEAATALANWLGVADETRLPYSSAKSVIEDGVSAQYAYDSNAYHLSSALRVNGKDDISYIKSLLQTYGAATLEYIHDGLFFYNYDTAAYYAPPSPEYYFGGGHQVTVVGWDDSFPVKNFGNPGLSDPERPPAPGAWICKNSWGKNWGKSGYFYISYYDGTIGDIWFFEGESGTDYDYLYQYDGGAFTQILDMESGSAKQAAVYTANSDEYVCAVGFYANAPNMDVHLTVHTGLGEGDLPDGGTPASEASITHELRYEGYYTLPLARPVRINAGERFSVVVDAACKDAENTVIFSYDAPAVRQYGVESTAECGDGQTYFHKGSGWQDVKYYIDANLRIKAMSIDAAEIDTTGFQAGDMNGDGSITLADAVLISRGCVHLTDLRAVDRMRADANADGEINVDDAVYITQYLVGLGPAPA